MTDHREQKEWAEGLRDRLVNAIAAAVCREDEKPDDERTLDWGSTDDLACVAADAVLAVVEPRVVSLAGEVERLRAGGDALGEWAQTMRSKGDGGKVIDLLRAIDDWMVVCHQQESRIEELEQFAAAALSLLPSERKGP